MYSRNGNTAIAIVLVILLMAGSVGAFFMMQMLMNNNPDPHDTVYNYTFEGTIDGEDYTGTGIRERFVESSTEYDYTLTYTVSSSAKTITDECYIFYGKDDKPVSKVFTYVGTDKIDDIEVEIWTYEKKETGTLYTYYTGGQSMLYRVIITSDNTTLTGDIILYE